MISAIASKPPAVGATLRKTIRQAWSAETTVDPTGWLSSNPAYGQCAVTAVVVQDHLGGTIWRSRINGVSHYFNILDGDEVIDLTREQFPIDAAESDRSLSSREYILSFGPTRNRYELLKARMSGLLRQD